MKIKTGIVYFAAALFLASTFPSSAQDLDRGKEIFEGCVACHGDAGQGNQSLSAPSIAGQFSWYLERQLTKFQKGIRGAHPDDVQGQLMRPMAMTLYHDNDIQDVAAYVASLEPRQPVDTIEGDPEKGKALYVTCTACHGVNGAGNKDLNAPNQRYLSDWYMLSQLSKFKEGLRGAHPEDAEGAQMRPFSMMLADDQAMKDIVAYIREMSKEGAE